MAQAITVGGLIGWGLNIYEICVDLDHLSNLDTLTLADLGAYDNGYGICEDPIADGDQRIPEAALVTAEGMLRGLVRRNFSERISERPEFGQLWVLETLGAMFRQGTPFSNPANITNFDRPLDTAYVKCVLALLIGSEVRTAPLLGAVGEHESLEDQISFEATASHVVGALVGHNGDVVGCCHAKWRSGLFRSKEICSSTETGCSSGSAFHQDQVCSGSRCVSPNEGGPMLQTLFNAVRAMASTPRK